MGVMRSKGPHFCNLLERALWVTRAPGGRRKVGKTEVQKKAKCTKGASVAACVREKTRSTRSGGKRGQLGSGKGGLWQDITWRGDQRNKNQKQLGHSYGGTKPRAAWGENIETERKCGGEKRSINLCRQPCCLKGGGSTFFTIKRLLESD